VTPSRDGWVGAVACLFTGSWRADLGADEGLPFVLGHALSMKAIHGGQAKHDQRDAPKMAAWLRGGRLPQASVEPVAMRATRDLRRRRTHLLRKRAALVAPGQHPTSPDHLPEIGKQMADQAKRAGVAERFAEAAVHKTIEVDLALITAADERRKDLALARLKTATHHDANPLSLLQTVPGMGKMLSRVLLYAIHRLDRLPSGPECTAYARLVHWSNASGGKRLGTSGQKLGTAHRTWAFSEAATLCLRSHPQGQTLLARLEKPPDPGKALSMLAHPRGRAVYCMLTRQVAFALAMCLQTSESRAGAPGASLDS
jgi:transposase